MRFPLLSRGAEIGFFPFGREDEPGRASAPTLLAGSNPALTSNKPDRGIGKAGARLAFARQTTFPIHDLDRSFGEFEDMVL